MKRIYFLLVAFALGLFVWNFPTNSMTAKAESTAQLKKKIAQLTTQLANEKKKTMTLSNQINNEKKKTSTLTNELATIKKQNVSYKANLDEAKKQITTLTNQKSNVESTVKTLQKKVDDFEPSDIGKLQQDVSYWKTAYEELDSDYINLNAEKRELQQELSSGSRCAANTDYFVYKDGIQLGYTHLLTINDKKYAELKTIIPLLVSPNTPFGTAYGVENLSIQLIGESGQSYPLVATPYLLR